MADGLRVLRKPESLDEPQDFHGQVGTASNNVLLTIPT